MTAAVANATATINERHKLETAMLVNQLELVQARADTDAVENAALKRKIEEYDAVLGEFEATCAEVEQSKVLALEEARAVRITLEERLDEARTKVGALAEELVNTRSRLEQVQEQYTTLQTSSREELARCKLDRDTALRAQEETGTKLAAANAEVARQKARVDRTLKVAQTKLGEAKTVHDKQHAQLVAMAGDLKASQAASRSSPAAAKAAPSDGPLTPGMKVKVTGLRNAKEHNGKDGVLISPVVKDGVKRWNLRLLTGELLALKAENLEREGGGPSMKAMVQALERAGEHEKAAMLRSVLPDE